MKNLKQIIAIIALSLLFLPASASAYTGKNYRSFSGLNEMTEITADDIDQAASLFVSPDGDDNNAGTVDAPFKTIQQAINKSQCDYTIYLRAGTYNEAITINRSNLTLRNYPEETAIITGQNLTGTIANIIVNPNLTDINIYGLKIQDRQEQDIEAAYGIIIHGGTRNLIIQNNEFQNINGNVAHKYDYHGYNAGAVVLYGDQTNPIQNALITGNNIHDMDCGKSEAITVTGYANKIDVIENTISNIFNIGIDIAGHYGANSDPNKDYARYVYVAGNRVTGAVSDIADNSGIYVDGAKGVLVERNYVLGCPYGISIDQENDITDENQHVEDIVVSSNLFIHNIKGGIRIGTTKLLGSSVKNSTVINNTVIQSASALSGALVVAKSHDNEIVNNIIYDLGSWSNLIYTDDYSTPAEIYNTTFRNNYLYSTNRLNFIEQRYLFLAGTQYTESEFQALDFTIDNILGSQITLSADNSAVAGTLLASYGYNHALKSILRDYNGDLGTDEVSIGHINVETKEDTAEDLAQLTEVFPFKKNYILDNINWNFTSVCQDNPDTIDRIYLYIMLLVASFFAFSYIRKHASSRR